MKTAAKRATQAGRTTAVAVAIVSAGLLLTLMAGGFGSYVGATGTEQNTGRTEHSERQDTPKDHQSTPAVRPHPRGLPRRGAPVSRYRRFGQRRDSREDVVGSPQESGKRQGVGALWSLMGVALTGVPSLLPSAPGGRKWS